MYDREPLYPGRVKLTPVSGQSNVYDMVRADQPSQAGSPLNKNTFLKDTTAALFGKTSAALPDEIFQILANAALYKDGEIVTPGGISVPNVQIETGSYVGTGTSGSNNPTSISIPENTQIVFIKCTDHSTLAFFLPQFLTTSYEQYGWNALISNSGYNSSSGYAKLDNTDLSWYDRDNEYDQLNAEGRPYKYIAVYSKE